MISKQRLMKWFILTFVIGLVYTNIELLTRAVGGELIDWNGIKSYSLVGWTSLWMIPIGGLSGYFVGMLNEIPLTRNWKVWHISFVGMIIIFAIEFTCGIICNKLLGMALWNYTTADIAGQISLLYAIPWFLLVPFVLWLDDLLRYYMFGEQRPAPIFRYYHLLQSVPRDDERIHSGN